MMNVAIVDDFISDQQILYDYIRQYCGKYNVHMQVCSFNNGTAFLNSLQKVSYDFVFLDIYMNGIDGISVAERLREECPKCQIIFCTTSDSHAVKAFDMHALDYLVKPYSYERLEETLNRCEKAVSHFLHFIEVKEGRSHTRVLLSDIIYVDYYNHYIQIHTADKVIRSYMPFAEFAPMLEPYQQFLHCYRNCMVNMKQIEMLNDNEFILKTGERIPISRGKKKDIIQAYANYVFNYVNGGTI